MKDPKAAQCHRGGYKFVENFLSSRPAPANVRGWPVTETELKRLCLQAVMPHRPVDRGKAA